MFKAMRELRRNESGAAMITALLFVIVMLFLLASISLTAISGLEKAKSAQISTNLATVVDSAVSNALSAANNPAPDPSNPGRFKDISDYEGIANAVYGVSNSSDGINSTEGNYKWLWYVEPINDAVVGESYDIVAKAFKDNYTDVNTKTVRVRLQAIPVVVADYMPSGKISYSPIAMGTFSYGLLGVNGLTLNEGAKVQSYNSALHPNPVDANATRNGTVSSNKLVAINGVGNISAADRVVLLGGNSENIPFDRCTTAENCGGKVVSYAYEINTISIANMVLEKCPNNASTYPDFIASTRGGVFDPSVHGNCFNNVVFDVDTELPFGYGSGKAAEMYIAGNVTVNAGIEVNENDSRGGPLALRIYSAAGTMAKFNSGTATDPTKFSGMVSGYNYVCTDTNAAPSAGKVLIFKGALACNTVILGAGTQAWWDQQTVQVLGAGKDRNIRTVWSPTTYDANYN